MATDSSRTNAGNFLAGQNVCVTGRLLSLTHEAFRNLVAANGGTFLARPKRVDFALVTGDDGWPTQSDGTPTHALTYAAQLQDLGYRIEIISERVFLEKIGVLQTGASQQRFTIRDLTRILKIPAARLRRWVRAGLLTPVSTAHQLSYFDFQQVTTARRLHELLAAGVPLRSIRLGLEQMRRWLPAPGLPLPQVAHLQQYNCLLWRVDDRLVDRHGQQHFEFDEPIPEVLLRPAVDVDYLFDRALAYEDSGDFEQAQKLYLQAVELAPDDTVLRLNLGNVQFAVGQFDKACASYRRSVEINPDHVEAWNNLGNTLAQLGRLHEAREALQQALTLVPDYEAAHESLADVMQQLGSDSQARLHRQQAEKPAVHVWLRVVSDDNQADRDGQS